MPLDPELEPHIAEAARLNNLDPLLLKSLLSVESSFRPGDTSEKNAGGIAQIIPETAQRYGIDNPYDPVQGIYGGARILNDALTNAEQIKANGRDISPVDYALKTYFGGNEGPKWGPLTAAYPGKIAARYQALQGQGNAQPSGVDQLAAVGTKSPGIADGDNGQPYVVPAQYAEERAAQGPQSGSTLPVMPQAYVFGKNPKTGTPAPVADYGTPQPGQTGAVPPGYKPPAPVLPVNLTNTAPLHGSRAVPGAGADGIAQLAAAGQPQPGAPLAASPAPASSGPAGMSDDDILRAFVDDPTRFIKQPAQPPAATPAQPSGPAASSVGVGLADPSKALYPPSMIAHLMTFPDGVQIAGQIQKFAEQGFQLNRDGTLSPIAGGPHDPRVVAGESRGKALMHLDAQGNTVNDPGVVPSVADKAGATKGAEASAELPSAVTKAQAEAWIKAGFDLKPGFDPKTGLPGYVNGRGQFLRLSDDAAQGPAVVSENPYLKEQTSQREDANKSAEMARNYRRLADDFVDAYGHIKDPGYGQQNLQSFRKIGQQVFQLAGEPVPDSLAKATSATEAANFIGQQLVASAAKEMSPRLAQQLVQQINAVKMSPQITQEGIGRLHKLIYGATQEPLDRQQFVTDYYNGDEGRMRNDAPAQFSTKFPTTAYNVIANGPFSPPENAKAVQVLRQNPGARDAFDKRFGAGSAAMVLGQ